MATPIENNSAGLQQILSMVNSLPTASSVQRKSGDFTTDDAGFAEVYDIGWKPDIVVIFSDGMTSDGAHNESNIVFFFSERNETGQLESCAASNTYVFIDAYAEAYDSGFGVELYSISWEWAWSLITNKKFNYVAIKYT